MTNEEKIKYINGMLDTPEKEEKLSVYLDFAEKEILNKMYPFGKPSGVTINVPDTYEMVQIMACVVGLTVAGAEGQNSHSENGIGRSFSYPTMVEYIHTHVVSVVGIL